MVKKKHQGHFCEICGEHKANEKFTGKGHAVHICKMCQLLPVDEQADMRRCRDVERVIGKYPLTRQDWELLEKYSKKYADKESGQFAQNILDSRRGVRCGTDIEDDTKSISWETLDLLPNFEDED